MDRISRRRFLSSAVTGAAVLASGCGSDPTGTAKIPVAPSADQPVPLGKTGLVVPRVAMGTGTHGWKRASDQTRLGEEGFVRLVDHGIDRGAAFVDAADLYGSHPFVKKALNRLAVPRDRVTLLSKIWFSEAPEMEPVTRARPEVERFLKEMGTDHLDICLLHCVQKPDWPVILAGLMEELSAPEERRQGAGHRLFVPYPRGDACRHGAPLDRCDPGPHQSPGESHGPGRGRRDHSDHPEGGPGPG